MSHPVNRNGHSEPAVGFDYDQVLAELDGPLALPDIDAEFWGLEGELLLDLLAWLTSASSLSGVGARCMTLVLYLRPELINPRSLQQISKMQNAPTAAALSKCLLELEKKYGLRPSPIQKPQWTRERFSRSAIVGHENRTRQQAT